MNCPKCGNSKVIVTDSRPTPDAVKRRRKCMDCGYRFSTVESIVEGRKSPKK